MAQVRQVVEGALRKLGIRDFSNPTKMAEAIDALNFMLASWDESLLTRVTEYFTLTAGTASYMIGTGGDFDTIRPLKIESAFIRSSDNYDYEVNVYYTRKEYNLEAQKNLDGRPSNLLYERSFPLGAITFDTEPETAETFYLTSYKPIANYEDLDETMLQPDEQLNAIIYNLAVELAPEYNQTPNNLVVEQAVILKEPITRRNSQPVPNARFDSALLRL